MSKIRNAIFGLGLSCISIFVVLVLGEVVLRHFMVIPCYISGYYPLGDNIAGASIAVDQEEFTIQMDYNRFGFRDREFPFWPKVQNEKRILFLGDSFVNGFGVQVDKRFSNQVEQKMDIHFPKWKITAINAGQLATNPISYLRNLADFGVALQPDFVVMAIFVGNDFMNGRSIGDISNIEVKETPICNDTAVDPLSYPLNFFRYTYSLTKTAINQKKDIVIRKNIKTFWDFYYKHKISKKFLAEHVGLSVEEFQEATSNLKPEITEAFIAGKLSPGYLMTSIVDNRSDEVQNTYYNDLDFENGVMQVIEMANMILSKRGIGFCVLVIPDVYQVYQSDTLGFLREIGYEKPPARVLELDVLRKRLGSV